MRQRSISAVVIVLIGLVPALLGGLIFTLVFAAITAVAFHEALQLLDIQQRTAQVFGFSLIALAALLAWLDPDGGYFPLVVALAVLVPLVSTVFRQQPRRRPGEWATIAGATLYLVLPAFAAIALRGTEGTVDRNWFQSLADAMPGPDTNARGLGLFLLALLITWMSDTAAYLVGKSIGRTKLIPKVSPNKTVEGALGGLVAAAITAAACVVGFGLDVHALTAVIFGIGVGVIGMLGDLSESMLKRRAGVKDSGTLIPGHGGMLDRIDALIFVLVATWALLPLITA